ncbi:hypothetical protein GCM10007385_28350 [Tateyamaria omphalii]|nr:hypothetical protein GCM10007385_28350 [Tateyamaria omphalii]
MARKLFRSHKPSQNRRNGQDEKDSLNAKNLPALNQSEADIQLDLYGRIATPSKLQLMGNTA